MGRGDFCVVLYKSFKLQLEVANPFLEGADYILEAGIVLGVLYKEKGGNPKRLVLGVGPGDHGTIRSQHFRAFLKGGDLNPGERHSRDTRDDGTVTLCTLRAATVLSRDCRADFGRPPTKKVMSHSRDGPGVTAPSRTNIVPLTGVWNPPPSVTPP